LSDKIIEITNVSISQHAHRLMLSQEKPVDKLYATLYEFVLIESFILCSKRFALPLVSIFSTF